ncbi:MAG: TIGR02679 family protein [Chromatiaceae bacterium]|nr:MAG: TIGR02679 family protein [Chromatiaceae bacterium]
MSLDRERLERLLGGEAATRLRRRLRERLERGGGEQITLTRATPEERERVERLLGRAPRRGDSLRLSLSELEDILGRAGIAPDLRTALEALDGPIPDRQAERQAMLARWESLFDAARTRARNLDLEPWLEELAGRGLLKRLSRGDTDRAAWLLANSLSVLEQLPSPGLNRSTLAARCLGDAHALDTGQPVAALVRRALARHWRGGVGDRHPDERTSWAHAGILVGGDITSTVLVYRLWARGNGPTDGLLAMQRTACEPVYLTLRQLLRHPPRWDLSGQTVFVCENPSVVAEAAERLGPDCAPILCTHGRPGAAVWVILEQLQAAGARLRVRADLDWAGLSIVNSLLDRLPAHPWRMDTATLSSHAHTSGRPLEGHPVTAHWDPILTPALTARATALQEEQLLDDLLEDLHP